MLAHSDVLTCDGQNVLRELALQNVKQNRMSAKTVVWRRQSVHGGHLVLVKSHLIFPLKVFALQSLELPQLPFDQLFLAEEFGAVGEELLYFGVILQATERPILQPPQLLLLQKGDAVLEQF